jgi:3-hydroxybutyryl-CoA dehydrogenase
VTWQLPDNIDERPVAVLGAGTLGARIALMLAAGGSAVRIFNRTPERAEAAARQAAERAADVRDELGLGASSTGEVEVAASVQDAVRGAWLVVESVAEDLALKQEVFRELDRIAEPDAVLATNSSSYPSSRLVEGLEHADRVLNLHFLMPPEFNPVEVMSSGQTDEAIIDALVERLPRYGLIPYRVRRESVGFIFNRVWAAIKREALMVVEEGVSTPEEVDRIWSDVFGTPAGPFRLMDQVGLDVVLAIEDHYAEERDGLPEGPRALLRRYLEEGRLGSKAGRGFYDDYGDPPA